MSDSGSEETTADNTTSSETKPSLRLGYLFGWFLFLFVSCFGAASVFTDSGLVNSLINLAVVLAVVGFAIWVVRNSGLKPAAKSLLAGIPIALVLGYYLQILPFEAVLNGDVGIVGWRWRGAEPDKQLEVPECESGSALDWQTTTNDYPRFLGNGYWAEVPGVYLETDWEKHPPKEIWRKKIGAGWSAFAIVGEYAITQEQRGDEELVVCYRIPCGEIMWTHSDQVRWDPSGAGSLGYAGPRATPTIHEGRVYTQGATGILNCLDAATGSLIWSHDTLKEHNAENIMWGKACSPLIVENLVVVSVGGENDQSLVAYDIETGDEVWSGGDRRSSYASPVFAELGGVGQILVVNENYLTSHDASNGKVLWEREWPSDSDGDAATSQPIPLDGDKVFISKGYSFGAGLFQVKRDEKNQWTTEPLWNGRQYGELPVMKTKMGNVLVRDGYVYGLDETILECIELSSGKKMWKKRRRPKFGHGQVMLIGDQILILSEVGELILVEASPEKFRELASMRAFPEEQITWNNPAFSAPYLLVRNAEEAVCYELPLKEILASANID